MTREPDRYEEKADYLREHPIFRYVPPEARETVADLFAAAIRQAESDALERAAQLFEEDAKQSEANAGSAWNHGESDSVVDHLRREARICRSDAARIRALASPAAAPAAEPSEHVAPAPICTCKWRLEHSIRHAPGCPVVASLVAQSKEPRK